MSSPNKPTESIQAVAMPDVVTTLSGITERGLNIVGAAPSGPIDAAAASAYLQVPATSTSAAAIAPPSDAPDSSVSE